MSNWNKQVCLQITSANTLWKPILSWKYRHVAEGTGWLLDGFPATNFQAKLLEKALTGGDGMGREDSKTNLKDKDGKKKKSKLAPDPKPAPPAPEAGSGINVVVLFDLPNETVLKRSAGRTCKYTGLCKKQTKAKTLQCVDEQCKLLQDSGNLLWKWVKKITGQWVYRETRKTFWLPQICH